MRLRFLCLFTVAVVTNAAVPVVIPPVSGWAEGAGGTVAINEETSRVVYDSLLSNVAFMFTMDMASSAAFVLPSVDIAAGEATAGDIYFKISDDATLGDEGYKIEIDTVITVTAKTATGYRRASMTLLQMHAQGALPQGVITDLPTTEKRWLSLDCARHFYSFDYLKDLVRHMSFYKMNGLILHAVDAEAFRFESIKYPELATPGGFYNRNQILELVQLGQNYGVEIIPGFEFPGHNSAFNTVMGTGLPEECAGSVYPWVTKEWIMDMTKPETMKVTQEVLTDILRWFPSKYVHLGADELPEIADSCPPVREYIDNHKDTMESFGDLAAVWTGELTDWLATSLKKQGIIYNGLEHSVKKQEVPKSAMIQFWTETGDFLEDYYLKNGYKVLNSMPSDNIFYLTPNAYHYIFPNPDDIITKWTDGVLPPDAKIEGHVFNIWGDYIYWLEDAYVEHHALLPRTMIASRTWNNDVSLYDSTAKFEEAMKKVGNPPGISGFKAQLYPEERLHEVHHWTFEPGEYEPSVLKSCPEGLCIFVEDKAGALHGSTYIASPAIATNNLVDAKYGQGLQWNKDWSKEGVGLGGLDKQGDWTWSGWIRLDERSTTMPLFWSRSGALMLGTPESGRIGITKFTGNQKMEHFEVDGDEFPADNRFHHLVFTRSGDTGVRVYLDGELHGQTTETLDLPMAAIMGRFPLANSGHTQSYITLDEVRVLVGSAEAEDVTWLKDMLPSTAANIPNQPDNEETTGDETTGITDEENPATNAPGDNAGGDYAHSLITVGLTALASLAWVLF